MQSFILLENIIFYAYHGVFEQETQVGNVFTVNLKIEVDLEKSGKSDKLDDTVSYADVYDVVKEEMDMPSKLLENVAYRIITKLRGKYDQIHRIELKLSKRNPPITGQMDCASVLLID